MPFQTSPKANIALRMGLQGIRKSRFAGDVPDIPQIMERIERQLGIPTAADIERERDKRRAVRPKG